MFPPTILAELPCLYIGVRGHGGFSEQASSFLFLIRGGRSKLQLAGGGGVSKVERLTEDLGGSKVTPLSFGRGSKGFRKGNPIRKVKGPEAKSRVGEGQRPPCSLPVSE